MPAERGWRHLGTGTRSGQVAKIVVASELSHHLAFGPLRRSLALLRRNRHFLHRDRVSPNPQSIRNSCHLNFGADVLMSPFRAPSADIVLLLAAFPVSLARCDARSS